MLEMTLGLLAKVGQASVKEVLVTHRDVGLETNSPRRTPNAGNTER